MAMLAFLWSGLGPLEWIAQVEAQVTVGFLTIGVILTPLWRWLGDPFTPGGAGSRKTRDGREVHEVLRGEEP